MSQANVHILQLYRVFGNQEGEEIVTSVLRCFVQMQVLIGIFSDWSVFTIYAFHIGSMLKLVKKKLNILKRYNK